MSVLPTVAILGRPNVGKSTLFNRIAGASLSLVDNRPGVTRDRIYATAEHYGTSFVMVDTGGLEVLTKDQLVASIGLQAQVALEEADVVLFVADGKQGLLPDDVDVVELLRRGGKPVVLAVNKIDGPSQEHSSFPDFYALAVEPIHAVSALHGRGVDELLDDVVSLLPAQEPELGVEVGEEAIRFAVVGRPNVGKSTLVNRLLGQERMLTDHVPGTTRDAVDSTFVRFEQRFTIIDTAGIRKKSAVRDRVEISAVLAAMRAIGRSQVVVLLIDSTRGVEEQDLKIASMAYERGRAIVLAVSKGDLVPMEQIRVRELIEDVRKTMIFLHHAPVVIISGLTGRGLNRLLQAVLKVYKESSKRVGTGELNRFLEEALAAHHPPSVRGRHVKFYYITQPQVRPPTFVIYTNRPQEVSPTYRRYLVGRLRKSFGFEGSPLRILLRGRKEREK